MAPGSKFNVDLNAPIAGSYDVLNVSGTASLTDGALVLAGVGSAGSYSVLNATGGFGASAFNTIAAGTFTQTPAYMSGAPNTLTLAVASNTAAVTKYWTGLGGGQYGLGDCGQLERRRGSSCGRYYLYPPDGGHGSADSGSAIRQYAHSRS